MASSTTSTLQHSKRLMPSLLPADLIQGSQARAADPTTDDCESPCGCWEWNSGCLEELPVLLAAEPPLQPHGLVP
ncbi:hypothetical protein ACRRTK_014316 [Alexandromys fortis]